MKKYLDTYPLIEIISGNPSFASYLDADFVLTDITLAEFVYVLLKTHNEQTAAYWYSKLEPFAKTADRKTLFAAMVFRHRERKNNYSFFDAVGYIYAQKNNMPFVTGDKAFKDKKGVEFKQK